MVWAWVTTSRRPSELASAATFPGVDSVITAAALNGLLTGGVSMTLAATTFITVNAPVTASGPVTGLVLDAPTVDLNQPIALPSGGTLAGTAATVNVGPSGSIQNGVDAAAAGATVNLATATYVQEVKITKSLVLQGQGAASTTIFCPIGAPHQHVRLHLNNATYHPIVLVESADPVTIQNVERELHTPAVELSKLPLRGHRIPQRRRHHSERHRERDRGRVSRWRHPARVRDLRRHRRRQAPTSSRCSTIRSIASRSRESRCGGPP